MARRIRLSMTPNTIRLIGDVLHGVADASVVEHLIGHGHVVTMKDGRPVVTLPARDAYFAHQRRNQPTPPDGAKGER